jgi:integral membrane protein (TIGR01906 family)
VKFLKIIASWIFILSIPLFCLTFAIDREFSTTWFYTYGFETHNVSMQMGMSKEELAGVADKFVEYFNSPEEYIDITFGYLRNSLFTEEEILHFRDVKGLVILDRYVMLGSLGMMLLGLIWWSRRNWRILGKSLVAGGILTAVLLVLFIVAAGTNFDWLFLQFHLISFSNNYWYSDGYMTQFFPQEFWYDMAMFTILITAATAAVIGGAGYFLVRLTGKKENE